MINVGIITASDRCANGVKEDLSAKVIAEMIKTIAGKIVDYRVLPDDVHILKNAMIDMCKKNISLILTTGGTGLSLSDNTPEATLAVIEKEVPGIPEAMRLKSLEKTPYSMLSRARAGIRGGTLIINLPGSPKAVLENLEVILPVLPHAIELLKGKVMDCGSKIKENQ